ncbi:hypothetical protein KKQ91_09800 [Clostridioides difficile]|nr:hypothetical protein [Clostridioides difficile]
MINCNTNIVYFIFAVVRIRAICIKMDDRFKFCKTTTTQVKKLEMMFG